MVFSKIIVMNRALLLTFLVASPLLAARQEEKISVSGFEYEELHSGNGMTALEFDGAGRMFVCEKRGSVLLFNPDKKGGFTKPVVFADFHDKVNPDNESGLLGIAIDPQFSRNHFLYVFYTGPADQKLVRLTASDDFQSAKPGSELVLLEGLPRTASNHKAGDIHIHPADPKAIYLVLGDDTQREKASDLEFYNGKLLRVDTTTGKGLSTNPFFDGNPESVRSRVWARGFRNPYRFVFMPGGKPDCVYVSENGDGTDRIARVERGADGGWGKDGDKGLVKPADPHTQVLFTSKPCMTSIAIAAKGPFAPDGPVLYAQNWFMRTLSRWKMAGAALDTMAPVPADNGAAFLSEHQSVHTTFGPDGALYMTQTYFSASEGNNHKLSRIKPVASRRP